MGDLWFRCGRDGANTQCSGGVLPTRSETGLSLALIIPGPVDYLTLVCFELIDIVCVTWHTTPSS
jgi:hypothetical protein